MGKTFQELDLSNAFLFAAALEDSETCRLILEIILGFPIEHVNVRAEHSMLFSSDFRSIRLDIYARDGLQVEYNIEMQNENEGNYRYTFENICVESGFPLNDGTKKIFLSTKGTNDTDVPEELLLFLHYVENSTDEYVAKLNSPTIQKIHDRVTYVKKSREWEGRFMTVEELLKSSAKKAAKKAAKETQDQILRLTECMFNAGEADQISRLREDPDFLYAMLTKYHLLNSEDTI